MTQTPTQEAPVQDPYRTGYEKIERLIVTTGNEVSGHDIIAYLAIVRGIVVRATSIGKGILGSFKALGGGNIKEFTEVCEAARHEAYQQMLQHAQEVGADAIIGMRYDATEFMQGSTEVLAYGTAVKLMRSTPR
ncbi:MAG TPA: YbjQ family protein [Kofleriaceae bacterium]